MYFDYYQEKYFNTTKENKLEYLFKWQHQTLNRKNSEPLKQSRKTDLNFELSIGHSSTFLMPVKGNSMIGAGIKSGNLLMADSDKIPTNGDVVIAELKDGMTVKRYFRQGKKILLKSENPDYNQIELDSPDKVNIWGVVTYVIKNV